MPEYHIPLGDQQTWQCLDAFTQGYWEAAFFTNQEEIGDLTFADVAKSAWERAVEDCKKFQTDNAALLDRAYNRPGYGETRAGTDFWFTRNGHGTGYWDRDELGALGDELSEACERREVDLYVSDDKIYLS